GPFHLAMVIRHFCFQDFDKGLEPLGPVGRVRIVLHVTRTEISSGRCKILPVDALLVEIDGSFLVGLLLCRIAGKRRRAAKQRCNGCSENHLPHDACSRFANSEATLTYATAATRPE